ncbi:MAG: hypothetical protein ACYCQI_15625 [Gammaproteobacteria bacterium]
MILTVRYGPHRFERYEGIHTGRIYIKDVDHYQFYKFNEFHRPSFFSSKRIPKLTLINQTVINGFAPLLDFVAIDNALDDACGRQLPNPLRGMVTAYLGNVGTVKYLG